MSYHPVLTPTTPARKWDAAQYAVLLHCLDLSDAVIATALVRTEGAIVRARQSLHLWHSGKVNPFNGRPTQAAFVRDYRLAWTCAVCSDTVQSS
jgi:hypothetical protein